MTVPLSSPHSATPVALLILALAGASGCAPSKGIMDDSTLTAFATKYTAAWCSQDPAKVASFFATGGSLTINAGAPSIGREAIAAAARGFMTAFPDLVVRMDSVRGVGSGAVYYWTLTGANTGPGGTGRPVRISGYEEWRFGSDGLVAKSLGHFDEAEYQRQVSGTNPAPS